MKGSRLEKISGAAVVGIILALATPAICDELVLKDGKKVVGTIVGFENGMFRVETDFGYALVRKDKVVRINITGEPEKPSGPRAIERPAKEPESARPEAKPKTEKLASISAPKPVETPAAALPPPPPPVSHPLEEPLPANLAEHVEGTNYFSDTFHFVMYKPPDWKLYEEISREKVSAIVAMSDEGDRTLLIVDRTVWSGAPNLKDDVVESKMRQMYADYQKLSETDIQVDGQPAIRRSFSGVVDGVEWHGVSARVAVGNTVFGIIGLTSAENYQFEEAVFNKIIKSFHFLNPVARSARSPQAERNP